MAGAMMSRRFAAVVREPLVHFLIAGFAIFAVSAWRGEPADPASRTITVDADQVSRLAASFAQTWQRAPRPDEIDALIREHIKDEVYAREAVRLGLDQDDPVIRRRLRQKMEFLATAAVDAAQPSEATLAAWLARNPTRYADDVRYSFDHVYLGDATRDAAERVRTAIDAGADWRTAGTPLSLPASFNDVSQRRIDAEFGTEFADALAGAKRASWSGPVRSGFGWHLVRVRAAAVSDPPVLADVRQRVENDWRAATRARREADAYQALLDNYRISISRP